MKTDIKDKTRYKRFERLPQSALPAFELTARDQYILSLLFDYGMLDTAQIIKLLSIRYPVAGDSELKGNTNRIRNRLNLMFHYRYIERPRKQYAYEKKRPDMIVMVGDRAVKELYPELPRRAGYYREKSENYTTLHIKHEMELNDFRVALLLSLHTHPSAKLKCWKKGKDAEDTVTFYDPKRNRNIRRKVKPDGLFVLEDGGADLPFCLEIDRSTMSHDRIRQKALAYRAWKESGKFQKKFGYKGFRVLFVATESKERAENLRKTIGDADSSPHNRLFLFSDGGRYSLDNSAPLLKPIWRLAEQQETCESDEKFHHLLE
jgi:hypothetical protein